LAILQSVRENTGLQSCMTTFVQEIMEAYEISQTTAEVILENLFRHKIIKDGLIKSLDEIIHSQN
jgi:hypothetical protein